VSAASHVFVARPSRASFASVCRVCAVCVSAVVVLDVVVFEAALPLTVGPRSEFKAFEIKSVPIHTAESA
jgi:hypothetical protein